MNFSTCAFLQRKILSFSIQKEKMNKRTKTYKDVKRENVAIATEHKYNKNRVCLEQKNEARYHINKN